MSSPMPWLLWTPLVRPFTTKSLLTSTIETSLRLRPPPRAGFQTSRPRRRPEVSQRYGTANEPPPHLGRGNRLAAPKENTPQRALPKPEQADTADRKSDPIDQRQKQDPGDKQERTPTDSVINLGGPLQADHERSVLRRPPSDDLKTASAETEQSSTSQNALSQILKMEPPISEEKPPHLQAPPYVHHFDTYTLVRALTEDESFTQEQAVFVMKAVRGMLADNMDLARDGIVGKGDAEMAAYLFRAACSELRTEMRNNRATLTERMRAERTGLQHEVEILAQRITADSSSLKDELKGMFDDRRMSVRMERRDIENQIQELNYKITARLNSEMRSEVEGLRWVLVRRTAIAIVIVAVTALLLLRLNSAAQKRAEEGGGGKKKRSGGGGNNGEGGGDAIDIRGLAAIGAGDAVASSVDLLKGLDGGGDPALSPVG